jgi:hypothetical protein
MTTALPAHPDRPRPSHFRLRADQVVSELEIPLTLVDLAKLKKPDRDDIRWIGQEMKVADFHDGGESRDTMNSAPATG